MRSKQRRGKTLQRKSETTVTKPESNLNVNQRKIESSASPKRKSSNKRKSEGKSPKKDSSDDSLERFTSSLWRMPKFSPSIPVIAVNEQEVALEDLAPPPSSSLPTISDPISVSEIFNFEDSSRLGPSSDSSPTIKERLVRDYNSTYNDEQNENKTQPGIHHQIKVWRRKLIILLWLNFLMRYRKHFTTFVEIFFPILAFGVICGGQILNNIYYSDTVTFISEEQTLLYPGHPFHPYSPMSKHTIINYVCANNAFCADKPTFEENAEVVNREFYIVYSPNTTFINKLMAKARVNLDFGPDTEHSKYYGVPTAQEVETRCFAHWKKNDNVSTFPMGIAFSLGDPMKPKNQKISDDEIPRNLKYTIRTVFPEIANTAENYPFVEHTAGPRTRHEVSPYVFTGFAGIQIAIDLAYIEMVKDECKRRGRDKIPDVGNVEDLYQAYEKSIFLRMFEYPFFLNEEVQHRTWTAMTITMILSYVCTNFCVVQSICYDAKTGKIELLKLHGMTPALHWASFGINTAVLRIFTSIWMTIVFYYCFAEDALLEYTSSIVVLSFLFLYGWAQDFQNLFIALWFQSPTTAGMTVVFKSFAEFLIPMRIYSSGGFSRIPNVILSFFCPQWCFAIGLHSYLQYEIYEDGLHWYDFPIILDTENYKSMSVEVCCIILLYSCTFYVLLTVYADRVLYKPFAPSISWLYCFKRCRGKKSENQKPAPPIDMENLPHMYEQPPMDLVCTIRLRGLSKTYETDKRLRIVLDKINLDIYEGEILAIVGQGGSGKTTLLHLIAGLINPTSGYVEIKNMKMDEESDFLNQFISIVPQRCMLFSTLSVEDHVRLCCMVHGISYRKSKVQAKLLLQLFGLNGFRRHSYEWLSYTQIKKLSMAMALASNPTILILDEPCQGMDTEASKTFWRHLLSLKTKRTVIVSTSRLEDTELYCDRMAILVHGKVVCYGSPGKIKRHYDAGSIVNLKECLSGEIDQQEVHKIVNSEVKGSVLLNTLGYEKESKVHRYLLPFGKPYAALLEKLEDEMEILKHTKVWISRVELAALFHKISISKGIESALVSRYPNIPQQDPDEPIEFIQKVKQKHVPDKPTLEPTLYKQFTALMTRKWLYLFQKHRFVLNQYIVPILLMLLIIIYTNDFLTFKPESLSRPLKITMYENSLTLVRPVSSSIARQVWFDAFKKAVEDTPTLYVDHTNQIDDELHGRKRHTLTNYRQQTIVAFERDGDHTTGYYSSNSFHSCPIALNVMANSFLHVLSEDKINPYKIQVNNYPIQKYEGFVAGSTQSNSTTLFGIMLSVVLALIAAAELRLPLFEKRNGIKTLELMSGVYPFIYWFTTALGDVMINTICTLILMGIVCFSCMENKQMEGSDEKYFLALIFFGYLCWTSPPYSYFLSHVLKTTSNGYGQFIVLHFFIGIIPKVICYQIFRTLIENEQFKTFTYIFHFFPPYTITSALVHYCHIVTERNYCPAQYQDTESCKDYTLLRNGDTISNEARKSLANKIDKDPLFQACCRSYCLDEGICHEKRKFFVDAPIPTLKSDIIAMAIQGIFYWILLLLLEYKIPQNCCIFFTAKLFGDKEAKLASEDTRDIEEPEDVKKEHTNVDYMIDIEDNVDTEVLLVQDVTKFYKDEKYIDHAYFSVPVAATTGILGLSKSGTTTLLKIITHEIEISSGYIYFDNERMLTSHKTQFTSKMGYCPQDNAYLPELTGFQMLQLIGRLRGITDAQLDVQVSRWINAFELQSEANITCKHYRPGVLRRFCCAMALIGAPRIVLMDHPTLNMDLHERDIFWTAIADAKQKGQTVLFTSSYSEEVQQCANKVLILDQGALVAAGGLEDVFKTNPRGFILSLRCRTASFKKLSAYQIGAKVDQLRDHIIHHLSPCELLLDEGNILMYQLKDLTTKLSYAYGIMEGAREKFPNLLDSFHISEPSLDDVVLNFHKATVARSQRASGTSENDEDGKKRFSDQQSRHSSA